MKIYAIHEHHYSDNIAVYTTSKKKAMEWLKLLDLNTSARLNNGEYGFKQTWVATEKALTIANLTKYVFNVKGSVKYYVEEINVI